MDIIRGTVAKSLAGRDKGGVFTVLSIDGKYAQICDGKTHRKERSKKKNIKHLCASGALLDEKAMATNSEIRKSLKLFMGKTGRISTGGNYFVETRYNRD